MKREVGGAELTWQVRTHFTTLYSISRYSVRQKDSRQLCVSLFGGEGASFVILANVVAQTALATAGLSHRCRSLSNVYFLSARLSTDLVYTSTPTTSCEVEFLSSLVKLAIALLLFVS